MKKLHSIQYWYEIVLDVTMVWRQRKCESG